MNKKTLRLGVSLTIEELDSNEITIRTVQKMNEQGWSKILSELAERLKKKGKSV